MTSKIVKFPVGSKKRKVVKEKEGKLECEVSGRWLQFPDASSKTEHMDYLPLNVMTTGSSDKERKICELILDKKQLEKMLSKLPSNES